MAEGRDVDEVAICDNLHHVMELQGSMFVWVEDVQESEAAVDEDKVVNGLSQDLEQRGLHDVVERNGGRNEAMQRSSDILLSVEVISDVHNHGLLFLQVGSCSLVETWNRSLERRYPCSVL